MFVGSFVEEIISPIPSFVVLVPAGAAAQLQGMSWWYLLWLALFCALGRLFASTILYVLADKAKNWLFSKKGRRFFGVSHKKLESYGQSLSGTPRDYWFLFALNALPIVPVSLIALSGGFIKVRFRLFASTIFFGAVANGFLYMIIGYAGLQAVNSVQNAQSLLQITGLLVVLLAILWFAHRYRQKKKRSR